MANGQKPSTNPLKIASGEGGWHFGKTRAWGCLRLGAPFPHVRLAGFVIEEHRWCMTKRGVNASASASAIELDGYFDAP